MNPKKSSSKNRRNDQNVGGIIVYEERVKTARGFEWGRWRVEGVKAGAGRPTFKGPNARQDAVELAIKLSAQWHRQKALKADLRAKKGDLETLSASQECNRFNDEENDPALTQIEKLNTNQAVEIAIQFLRSLKKINSARTDAGVQNYSANWMLGDFENHVIRRIFKVKSAVKYKTRIRQFLEFKLGPNGNKRGRTELEDTSKSEWTSFVGKHLLAWAGDDDICERKDSRSTIQNVISAIDQQKSPTGKNWGASYKRKCADKIKQFGDWLVKNDDLATNPYENLPGEFAFVKDKRIERYQVDDIAEMLRVLVAGDPAAAKNAVPLQQLLPYMIFNIFGSVRPSDIAHRRDAQRRFKNDQLMRSTRWDTKFSVPGCYLDLPMLDENNKRKGKTVSRYGILFDPGLKWLNFWEKEFNGGQEINEVFWGPKPDKRFKALLSKEWIDDGLRHTCCTMAVNQFVFNGAREWLADRFGHTLKVQEEFYAAPCTTAEAEAFFNLTPENVL